MRRCPEPRERDVTAPPAGAHTRPAPQRSQVRWKIFLYLFGFGFILYMQQRAIPVAGIEMMPRLNLSQLQIAWLEQALLVGYTVMQFPGGVLGQKLGARRSFILISLIALGAYVATPLAPLLAAGTALLALLVGLQLLLGAAQGPVFPVSAGVFQSWFAPDRWPLVQGLQSMGLQLGAAVMPPLISSLMYAFGWQQALLWSSLPALLLIWGWAWYGRDTPAEHPSVSAAELAELSAHPVPRVDASITWSRMWALLRNRDVLLLTASYVCLNYVFYLIANWCFLYLVQERHFTVLESGWLASTPPLAAAIGAGVGGKLASSFAVRYGVRRGLAIVPLVSLPAAAVLQFLAVDAVNAYLAVVALALCFAAIELNEGPYWAAIMHVGRADAMAASGLLNTGGNGGGLIATPIVGYLSSQHQWTLAFWIGAAFAIAGGAAWLLIDPAREPTR